MSLKSDNAFVLRLKNVWKSFHYKSKLAKNVILNSSAFLFIWNHMNYYRLHLSYFIFLDIIGALFLWLSPKPLGPIPFIDALFVSTSALTESGLISLKMNRLSIADKLWIMLLILLGSQWFTSLLPVFVRRYHFYRFLNSEETVNNLNELRDSISRNIYSLKDDAQRTDSIDHEENKISVGSWQKNVINSWLDTTNSAGGNNQSNDLLSTDQSNDQSNGYISHNTNNTDESNTVEKNSHILNDSNKINSPSFSSHNDSVRKEDAINANDSLNSEQGNQIQTQFSTLYPRNISTTVGVDPSLDGLSLLSEEVKFLPIVEYKALVVVCWLVPLTAFSFILLSFFITSVNFIIFDKNRKALLSNGVNPTFFSAFISISAYGNCGLSLMDDSLVSFQTNAVFLFTMSVLILVGNTMLAPTMRLIIFTMYKCTRGGSRIVYKYLLDNPRKCYTHLFPSSTTQWLVFTVFLFNSIEFFFFLVLDWKSMALTSLSHGGRIVVGIFQSISTRSAGFNVISLTQLSPAMLLLYVGMMYVAAYPVFLSRQQSQITSNPARTILNTISLFNIKERLQEVETETEAEGNQGRNSMKGETQWRLEEGRGEEIGVAGEAAGAEGERREGGGYTSHSSLNKIKSEVSEEEGESKKTEFLSQGRLLLTRDSILLFIISFLICIIQNNELKHDPLNFNVFNILFEVVSGYGNVGLSLGYTCPSDRSATCVSPPYSFSGVWKSTSKFLLILIMLFGRQRGLPDSFDSAISIPNYKFQADDKKLDSFENVNKVDDNANNNIEMTNSTPIILTHRINRINP